MKEKIEFLRLIFRILNAAFAYTNQMQLASGKDVVITSMQKLTQECEKEVCKDNPDLDLIGSLLLKMDVQLIMDSLPKRNFTNGGIGLEEILSRFSNGEEKYNKSSLFKTTMDSMVFLNRSHYECIDNLISVAEKYKNTFQEYVEKDCRPIYIEKNKMQWIKIDKDNLPKNDVLAGNFEKGTCSFGEKLIGWLGVDDNNVICCESNSEVLYDCTHYIDIHKFNPIEE